MWEKNQAIMFYEYNLYKSRWYHSFYYWTTNPLATNPNYVPFVLWYVAPLLYQKGLSFIRALVVVSGHPYFVAVQYHPEYISRPMKPSAPYLGLVLASINRLNTYISRGCRLSPRNSFSDTESSDTEEEMASLMNKSLSFTGQESSPQQL